MKQYMKESLYIALSLMVGVILGIIVIYLFFI